MEATPFVPGQARGVLRRGMAWEMSGQVLLLYQAEVEQFARQAAELERARYPAALVVAGGAPLSHPMIRLLGLGIPTVIVTPIQAAAMSEGEAVAVDGGAGFVGQAPPAREPSGRQAPGRPPPGTMVHTADGKPVALRASVPDRGAAALALANGANAVGLVRSEYLTLHLAQAPDTDFFIRTLRDLCEAAYPLPVTIRTLDFAADKCAHWVPKPAGMAGALGLQGSRLYDHEPVRSAFLAQVDAVAHLAQDFELRLLLPFITRPEEFRHWRDVIHQRMPLPVPVGTMVETPAAALEMSEWTALADFAALGCNDLMQCLFAADRDAPQVASFLDPYAPALYRLLRHIAKAAGERVGEVQVCGLLPQVFGVMPVLLGFGFRTFSVEPVLIPHLAAVIAGMDAAHGEALADGVCAEPDSASVRSLLGVARGQAWAFGAAHDGYETRERLL